MAAITYLLCALTAFLCAWLILRSYRMTRHRILLWAGICFGGLFISNLLLVADRILFPSIDLLTMRLATALAALLVLLYGLILEDEE